METSRPGLLLTEDQARDIEVYFEVAKSNGGLLSLREIIQLTSVGASEEELLGALESYPRLSAKYFVEGGYVFEKASERVAERVDEHERGMERARENVTMVREFASLCITGPVRLFSVSGGNSYQLAREGDDIDFFCVTRSWSMWSFITRSLIISRIYRLTRKVPVLCFSCVMDESRAAREFSAPKDGLYARDALTANVLFGAEFYHELLKSAGWMEEYLPKIYRRRLAEAVETGQRPPVDGNRVLNGFLYAVVGTYIRVKAHVLNIKYRRSGLRSAEFQVKVGVDHCIYESNRYKRLRTIYAGLGGAGAG